MTTCRVCNGQLKDVASFGDQYLSNFNDGEKGDKYPLDLMMCSNCTLVQLKKSTPVEKLYTENYGYKSGINDTIREDLKDIVVNVEQRVKLWQQDIVFDIGANDGTLLSNYSITYHHPAGWIIRVGCEPIKKLAEECKKHAEVVINDFFSLKSWQKEMGDKKAKVITIISCFYDLEDPNKFVEDLTKILAPNGMIIIQQNYLGTMIQNNAFDNIVHEHIEYYSLKALEYLLNRHGLEVVDVELNDINGGSFRAYVKFKGSVAKLREWEQKNKLDNWGTYLLFNFRVQSIKNKLLPIIQTLHSEGKKIYLYGASTRAGSLCQYLGLDHTLIDKAVERNPEKFGKIMASTGIPIISEEQAKIDKPDYALLGPWFFADEIIERSKDEGIKFIIPLPEVKIV